MTEGRRCRPAFWFHPLGRHLRRPAARGDGGRAGGDDQPAASIGDGHRARCAATRAAQPCRPQQSRRCKQGSNRQRDDRGDSARSSSRQRLIKPGPVVGVLRIDADGNLRAEVTMRSLRPGSLFMERFRTHLGSRHSREMGARHRCPGLCGRCADQLGVAGHRRSVAVDQARHARSASRLRGSTHGRAGC